MRFLARQKKQTETSIIFTSGEVKKRPKMLVAPRVLTGLLVMVLIAGIVISGGGSKVLADTIVQNDWSGGVGSGGNQYSVASNVNAGSSITLGSTVNTWCSSTNCSSSWTRRKLVTINNPSAGTLTNQAVQIHVDYDSDMQADFDDLRVVNQAGDTDLAFFIEHKVNSDEAEVWVKVPSIAASSTATIYIYYGNAGAASTAGHADDVAIFADTFEDGAINSPWTSNGTVSGNEAHLGTGGTYLYSNTSQDRSISRAYEWSMRPDFSTSGCSDTSQDLIFNLTGNIGVYFQKGADCDGTGQYLYVSNIREDAQDYAAPNDSIRVHDGETIRIRMVAKSAGGVDYYYSLDEGRTYTQFSFYTSGSAAGNVGISVNHNTRPYITVMRHIFTYQYVANISAHQGIEQFQGGYYGYLESPIFDVGANSLLGNVTYSTTGSGEAAVLLRTGEQINLSDADAYYTCNPLTSGSASSSSSCVNTHDRYVQYRVELSSPSPSTRSFSSMTINYVVDTTPPGNASALAIKTSPSGTTITNGGWTKDANPYLSWTAATDNVGGSGILGYCLYVGTSSSADPLSTSGLLTDPSPINTGGTCPYAVSATNIDLDTAMSDLTSQGMHYFSIKAIDNLYNVASTSAQVSFGFDNVEPSVGTLFSYPSITNSEIFSVTWIVNAGTSFSDSTSGPAGFKYCVSNFLLGLSGCGTADTNWYGLAHTSGRLDDSSDVVPFSNAVLTTVAADADRIDGDIALTNFVYVRGIDNAGNWTDANTGVVVVTHNAASAPTNLVATPTSNSVNEFSFSWDQPTTFMGPASFINYCWTVNEPIQANQSNCNWTGAGNEVLAQGPYATQQGTNTLRVVAKDQSQNFNEANVASVNFTASTASPGAPQNMEISDVSIRATSSWKLAMSWSAPTGGPAVSTYKIYRSTDNQTFSQVGSTSNTNLSFIDSGLSQIDYYYHVKACDNANSCGVASNVVTKKPTGRYTTPAILASGPSATGISTRKATVSWVTDRESDSKIAFGTKPGQYSGDEIGNSSQVIDHVVNLSNLQPGTTYYYVAKWTDGDGNTGTSPEKTFTTSPAPSISEVSPSSLSVSSATLGFKVKNATKATVHYGKNEGFGGIKEINTSTAESAYTIPLTDLEDGTKYFYKINTVDSDGNDYSGDIYTFVTPARPRITSLRFQPVEGSPSSTQKITWQTNVPATSALSYGPRGAAQADALDSKLVTEHEMIIQGLEDDTEYTLTARSVDGAGNAATSDVQQFKTALDTRPPKISDLNIETAIRGTGSEARGQIVVSWRTDEKSTSQVAFGQGQSGTFTNRTAEDNKLSTEHVVIVSDLSTSSIFNVQAISNDKSGNSSFSESQSAVIGRGSENVFTIIFNALQRIFGLGD